MLTNKPLKTLEPSFLHFPDTSGECGLLIILAVNDKDCNRHVAVSEVYLKSSS